MMGPGVRNLLVRAVASLGEALENVLLRAPLVSKELRFFARRLWPLPSLSCAGYHDKRDR